MQDTACRYYLPLVYCPPLVVSYPLVFLNFAPYCGLSYAFSVRKAKPSVCIVGYDSVGGGDGCIW